MAKKPSKRNFYVLMTLASALTVTGGLLLALAPQPLAPDTSLSATADLLPPSLNHWKYIYLHHARPSQTGDHFTITPEGTLVPSNLWTTQSPATPPGVSLDPACISISLTGDFNKSSPTDQELRTLNHLITSLQSQFHLPNRSLILLKSTIGKHFPASDYDTQTLH